MAIQLATTFDLYGSSDPNFSRDKYETTLAMREVDIMDNGHIVYCTETDKHYVFKKIAGGTKDATLGWFVELETGSAYSSGSGITVGETTISVNKGDGLNFSSNNALEVKPKANSGIDVDSNGVSVKADTAKGISVGSDGVGVNVKSDGGISASSDGLELLTATLNQIGGLKCTVDTANKLFKIKEGNDTWIANMTKLITPNPPSISGADSKKKLTINVVTGNGIVTVIPGTTGASMEYCTAVRINKVWGNYSAYTDVPSNNQILLASGFMNSITEDHPRNTDKEYKVKLKSILNGQTAESDDYFITLHPKVANPTITITRGGNKNKWSTNATVTLTISDSQAEGVVNQYKIGTGEWTSYTPSSGTTTYSLPDATSTISANYYQARATYEGYYADSDIITQPASELVLNAPKTYYGWMPTTTVPTVEKIKALGNSVEQDTLTHSGKNPSTNTSGNYTISSSGTTSGTGYYLWLCCPEKFTGTASPSLGNPSHYKFTLMNSDAKVGNWWCYCDKDTQYVPSTMTNIYIE